MKKKWLYSSNEKEMVIFKDNSYGTVSLTNINFTDFTGHFYCPNYTNT